MRYSDRNWQSIDYGSDEIHKGGGCNGLSIRSGRAVNNPAGFDNKSASQAERQYKTMPDCAGKDGDLSVVGKMSH